MMYWLCAGDITRYLQVRKQSLRLAMEWLVCRFKAIDDERRFIAACHGAELKTPRLSKDKKSNLRGLMGMMQSLSRGGTKMDVERVRVTPEDIQKRSAAQPRETIQEG